MSAPTTIESVATDVLRVVFSRRRSADLESPCEVVPCPDCFEPHLRKVAAFIEADRPIHFILPGFPAKCPNPRKTLGRLPDMAEILAIESLQGFCDLVSAVYPPGAIVTICSDGHVFADVLGIPDGHVDDYSDELHRVIRFTGGGSIGLYGLRDALPDQIQQRRERLLADFSDSVETLREAVRSDAGMHRTFNGIHRFMVEDAAVLAPEASATQRRKHAKQTAYDVLRRSQAWSRLIAGIFPDSIRLSIHPQPQHDAKIGFHLLRTHDSWLTPWHGVVLDDGTTYTLVKRAHAEALGARVIWRNSRPSHFVSTGPADLQASREGTS